MSQNHRIGLVSAILINLNLMVSSGVFINIAPLLHLSGSTSFVSYLGGAACLIPIVLSVAYLAQELPNAGGLYGYSKTYLTPWLGFVSGWSYYMGKAISAGLMLHLFAGALQHAVPFLSHVPHLLIDVFVIGSVVLALIGGLELQGPVQYVFMAAKLIPITLVLLTAFMFGDLQAIDFADLSSHSLVNGLSTSLFALIGFEASTAIVHLYENPKKQILPATLLSFLGVIIAVVVVQFSVSVLLTGEIALFPLKQVLVSHYPGLTWLPRALYMCVYTSIIGGSYVLMASNPWNMHTLASNDYFPGKKYLTYVYDDMIPPYSLIVTAVLSFLGVVIAQNQIALQNMVVFCVVITFMVTMAAALVARKKNGEPVVSPFIVLAALASTGLLLYLSLHRIYLSGVSVEFLLLYGMGYLLAFFYNSNLFGLKKYL